MSLTAWICNVGRAEFRLNFKACGSSPGTEACGKSLLLLLVISGLTLLGNVRAIQAQQFAFGADAESLPQAVLNTASGEPYGVGQVELPLSLAIKNGWHSDQSVEVDSSDCKVWLPAIAKVKSTEPNKILDSVDKSPGNDVLRILFLYQGHRPSAVDLHISGKASLTIRSEETGASHRELMRQWWDALQSQPSAISPDMQELTEDILLSIGKHLSLPLKRRQTPENAGSSELEQQFERTLGMLLGFESVRLAMMIDDVEKSAGSAPAMISLPNPVNVVRQRIPSFALDSSAIEPIASLVPNDCFYVRCGSINNYMWLRRFLIGWGGSLDEIVTNPTLNTNVRGRIEDQLGINSNAWLNAEPFVSDIAVIGSDVFFTEGAGVGILLEATPGDEQRLEAIIQQQRFDKSKKLGASHHSETIANHQVSLFHTADNRMRSFFVRHGRYLLVTNSQAMLTSITSPQAAERSLANLEEYRYALASNQMQAQAGITIYLSDPFIRRLTSPACRVELGRRRASAADCRQLEVAAMVAKAFGLQLDSRQSLIAHNFLPEDFGIRPDGSHVEIENGVGFDTLRGRPGTFIPVADVATTTANQRELSAFSHFANRYRAEWPAMDPVLVSIASSAIDDRLDRVELQIHITPYARNEYRFLTNYLSQPSVTHATLSQRELMGVSARLKTPSREVLAHLGVRDAHVPFRVHQGELHRTDDTKSTFTQQQSFAAVTPSGTDGLRALSGLMQSLQNRNVDVPPEAQSSSGFEQTRGFNLFNLGRTLTNPADVVINDFLIRGLLGIAKLGALDEDEVWSIYGGSSELRRAVRESLEIQYLGESSQLLFRAGGLDQAEVAPYLNAYSYCQSRNQSAAIASWLNQWSIGLRSDPIDFRRNVEQALKAELACPLGGKFTRSEYSQLWTSSKWPQNSLALEDHVPDDYHFPFLQWLKEVQLSFNLTRTSLNTDVVLKVARSNSGGRLPLELHSFSRQHSERRWAPFPSLALDSKREHATGPASTLGVRVSRKATQALTNATFSSSGEQVLVGGFGRTAHVFDAQNLKELMVLRGHQKAIWTVALSPDGNTAVTGSEDKTLRFWNAKTGQELHRIRADGIFSCVRYSPDGNTVFATNWDGRVRVIGMPNFRVNAIIDCGQPTLDISVFQDGKHFVVGTPSGEILLYDSQTRRAEKSFVGHTGTVHSVALFRDGKHFLSASHDHTLRLWNVATGKNDTVYRGHTAAVHEVRLAPNERQFVSCSADGTVRLWDVASATPRASSTAGKEIRGISISPDGSSVAAVSMDGLLQVLKLE